MVRIVVIRWLPSDQLTAFAGPLLFVTYTDSRWLPFTYVVFKNCYHHEPDDIRRPGQWLQHFCGSIRVERWDNQRSSRRYTTAHHAVLDSSLFPRS